MVAAFVADLDRLLGWSGACSVSEVEDRFEPIEAVQEFGGAAAGGKELHHRVGTSPTEFVARIHHAPEARLGVQHLLEFGVQCLVDGEADIEPIGLRIEMLHAPDRWDVTAIGYL